MVYLPSRRLTRVAAHPVRPAVPEAHFVLLRTTISYSLSIRGTSACATAISGLKRNGECFHTARVICRKRMAGLSWELPFVSL